MGVFSNFWYPSCIPLPYNLFTLSLTVSIIGTETRSGVDLVYLHTQAQSLNINQIKLAILETQEESFYPVSLPCHLFFI